MTGSIPKILSSSPSYKSPWPHASCFAELASEYVQCAFWRHPSGVQEPVFNIVGIQYTHGVFIIELYRGSVISTMHACDLVRNMSLFPLQLTNTLSKAFLCSPPALHCLKTSWDTSSFPLAGLGEHTLRSVCRWIHPARSLHHMSHAAKALTLRWHVFQKPLSRNRWNLRTSSIYGNLAKMAMIP